MHILLDSRCKNSVSVRPFGGYFIAIFLAAMVSSGNRYGITHTIHQTAAQTIINKDRKSTLPVLANSMEPLFRVAKQNRIFQDVVDQIQEAIIDGRLKVGDRLPSERELKDTLQTSRSTLREALRVLEQKGLIEIKLGTGGGAVVKAVTADQVTESLDLLIRSQKVSLIHLAEFRESIEGDVVAIAAQRAGDKEIERLKQLLNTAEACVARGSDRIDDFLQVDKKLHLTFAQISKNPIYISVLKTIHDNIGRYYEQFLTMKDREMVENLNDLRDIVKAVEEKQPEKGRKSAQMHVRRFNRYMKKQQQTASD